MSKKDRNKLLSALGALAAIIVLISLTVRFISGSETLADYAKAHPEEHVKPEITQAAGDGTAQAGAADKSADGKDDATGAAVTEAGGPADTGAAVTPGGGISDADVQAADTPETDTTEAGKDSGSGQTLPQTEPSPERVTYAEGFYYEPVPDVIRDKMKGVSYPLDIDESRVNYDVLRYVRLKYIDFDGNEAEGEMVCNAAIAQDVVEIFHELYLQGYQIERIRLIDDYDADDTASMLDNNTSCFCYRTVEGSSHLSNHAYGRAIDLNPFYNPYIVYGKGENGGDYISPEGSEIYVDRTADFPHKIDENDLAYKLFMQHGFKWGGNWNTQKDYQHFEKKA